MNLCESEYGSSILQFTDEFIKFWLNNYRLFNVIEEIINKNSIKFISALYPYFKFWST